MIEIYKKIRLALTICMFFLSSSVFADGNVKINVYPNKIIGKINPLIFGSAMLSYDTADCENSASHYFGYSNYGGGIWNPKSWRSVPEVITLAKDAGIKIFRFPGCVYDWKKTIGSTKQRADHLYGLDEFMNTCEEIGCQALFTIPNFDSSPQDAADFVEYLNAPADGANPGGGTDWAKERAKNGHPAPYGVKFFELGNEVYSGRPIKKIPPLEPGKYAADYIKFKKAIKTVDPAVQLGAVTVNSSESKGLSPWNNELFKNAGDFIDFLIEHTYRPLYTSNDAKINSSELIANTLDALEGVDNYYKKLSVHFEKVTGRKNIPIAVTEYNAWFVQEKPVPFRHSLGGALFNAGLLQILMKPENNILMANNWQFIESYWGMIKNDQFMELKGTYVKRPNYYVFEMFHKHFGDELINVALSDDVQGYQYTDLLSGANWQVRPFSGADVETKKDMVEVSFPGGKDLNFYHVHKKVSAKPNTTYYLSGYLKAEDLKDNEGVCLTILDGRGWNETHSAETTERVWGTTDWIKVETTYTTLGDAKDVSILIRRLSGKGLVKGKVSVKEVKLSEVSKGGAKGSKALSVSASRNKDKTVLYLMVLNKNVLDDKAALVQLDNVKLSREIDVWTLNGLSVASTNEEDPNNVTIKHQNIRPRGSNALSYIFPAHSLTVLEVKLK